MVGLPTYTDVWAVERRLYKIEDWVLPTPISLLQAGAFGIVALLWWAFLTLVGIGFGAQTGWVYLLPPAAAAWAAGRPVAEHKRPHEVARSYARYLLAPKELTRMAPAARCAGQRVRVRAWRRCGAGRSRSRAT